MSVNVLVIEEPDWFRRRKDRRERDPGSGRALRPPAARLVVLGLTPILLLSPCSKFFC